MNYSLLLGRAWAIVRGNRFIWWLGLLAMFTEGGGGGGGFNFGGPGGTSSPDHDQEKSSSGLSSHVQPLIPQLISGHGPRLDSGIFPGGDPGEWLQKTWDEALPYLGLVIAGFVLLFLLGLVLMYFSFSAQAGLILSVQELETRRLALGFSLAMDQGKAFFWRLFGLSLLVGFAMLFLLLVLAAPVIGLAVLAHKQVVLIVGAVILGILCLMLLFAAAWYANLLLQFAKRRLVLTDGGISEALTEAHRMIMARLGTAAVSWLVALAVQLAYGLAMMMAVLLVGIVLVALGAGIWAVAKLAGVVIYAIVVGSVLVATLLGANGVFTGFISTYWTLIYRAMEGLQVAPNLPGGPWSKPVGYGKAG